MDVLSPLRNNQVSASEPEYTGKIIALDTLYGLRGVTFRGDSTTPGSPLAPVPAPEPAFSWNGFATLPYAYATHDPSQLPSLLAGAEGAGAGSLFWPKENWLKTARTVGVPPNCDKRLCPEVKNLTAQIKTPLTYISPPAGGSFKPRPAAGEDTEG